MCHLTLFKFVSNDESLFIKLQFWESSDRTKYTLQVINFKVSSKMVEVFWNLYDVSNVFIPTKCKNCT